MKQTNSYFYLLVFGLLCSLCINKTVAQVPYHSIIQEDAYWQSFYMEPGNTHALTSGQHFFFEGDTVVNNETYSILYYHPFDIQRPYPQPPVYTVDSSQTFKFALIREDSSTQQVYIISNYNGGQEELLFDYSWVIGDTLPPCYINNTSYPKVVDTIDTVVLADGSIRRRWIFDLAMYGMPYNYFIEGVGSSQGYYYPVDEGIGFYYTTECYNVNSTPLYGSSSWTTNIQCFDFLNNANVPTPTITKIYPNPAQHQIVIEHTQEKATVFQLYNALGQLALEANIHKQQEVISVEGLPSGVYHYMLGASQTGTLVIESK